MATPLINLSVKVDDRAFQEVFSEYLTWSKKQPAEIVNAKLYFIALNALNTTKASSAADIKRDLSQASEKYPEHTIGEVLTIMDLRKRNKLPKRGKTLVKNMARYVQRFENKRASHINFLRSGWLPAIKKLDYWNRKGDLTFIRRFAPKRNREVKQYGRDKGRILPARLEMPFVKGTIFNDVGKGEQASSTVHQKLQQGLDKAVLQELRSMVIYINRKVSEKHSRMASRMGSGVKTTA